MNAKRHVHLVFAFGVILLGGLETTASDHSRCLLLDVDMDLDDALALAYSCTADAADLRAVTLCGTGFSTDLVEGVDAIRRLLHLCGRAPSAPSVSDVAVAAGRSTSLSGTQYHFPMAWSQQAARFFRGELPPVAAATTSMDANDKAIPHAPMSTVASTSAAAQLIVDTARTCAAEGRKLDIVITAPMTNLAEALRLENNSLLATLGDVYFAGGNLNRFQGNDADCGGGSNTAECNVFLDVVAASEVLASGVRMHIIDSTSSGFLPVPTSLPQILRHSALRRDWSARAGLTKERLMQQFVVGTLETFLATTNHQLYFYDPSVAVWRHHRQLLREEEAQRTRSSRHLDGWSWEKTRYDSFCLEYRQIPIRVALKDADASMHKDFERLKHRAHHVRTRYRYGTFLKSNRSASECKPWFCWTPNGPQFMANFLGTFFNRAAVSRAIAETEKLRRVAPYQSSTLLVDDAFTSNTHIGMTGESRLFGLFTSWIYVAATVAGVIFLLLNAMLARSIFVCAAPLREALRLATCTSSFSVAWREPLLASDECDAR